MTTYVLREGRSVAADEAFFAWTSGNLDRMVAALTLPTNPIDRHFLLQGIVSLAYKQRKASEQRLKLCRDVGQIHQCEFPIIAPHLKNDMGGNMPRVTTFPQIATVLTEGAQYDMAIAVCEFAIAYGLGDGTAGGYPGRIARIRKVRTKAAPPLDTLPEFLPPAS
jgi:hypothetical protein